MEKLPIISSTNGKVEANFALGGKAKNLLKLSQLGFNVPQFVVIPHETLMSLLPTNEGDWTQIKNAIHQLAFPKTWIAQVLANFDKEALLAVRSSAIDEDGNDFSFAGQFESYLFVNPEQVEAHIKKVWLSAYSNRVQQYRKLNQIDQQTGIAVIVQQMVNAQVSGVAFGANPLNGQLDTKIISAVYGLGEGLVSGELNADTYEIEQGSIKTQLADKVERFVFDQERRGGLKKEKVEENKRNMPALSDKQIHQLTDVLSVCGEAFGRPQDMEFAFEKEKLFLLQARPITRLGANKKPEGLYTLWDNSNIIESYPGVTTPLTFSFISKSYEGAYKLFSAFMGVSPKVIKEHERVFANTLGLLNGRVYYNLKTWYHMLAMLPGYSINARFMENMMGVKERFDIPKTYQLSKGKAWLSIVQMAVSMTGRFLSLPKKRSQFMQLLNETIGHYKSIDYKSKSSNELMTLYLDFEKKLLNEWKAPLLNDFFAMIWFGLLQKRCAKISEGSLPNLHNDLLCGSSDIISTQPIHRSMALAAQIIANADLRLLFNEADVHKIWHKISHTNQEAFVDLKHNIDQYLVDFGERCIGELKLETISYTQDPTKFIKLLKSYVASNITEKSGSGNIEESLRLSAENELNKRLRNKPIAKWRLKRTIRLTRELVSARENLRYERTRAFGIVREIFSNMGLHWQREGILHNDRDIFYLTKEEIFAFIEGTAVTQHIQDLIALRKAEFEGYKKQEPPAERFATYGVVYYQNDFFGTDKMPALEGGLKGIGCCPGRVKGKVRIVLNPDELASLDGNILVTSSTDPGWVTLFPSASAIIVERGSLLSHSAIVSREMGIPCIVGVTGLLKTLNTGDEIEMDGSTGHINIINKAI